MLENLETNIADTVDYLVDIIDANWFHHDCNENSENYFHLVLFSDGDIQLRTGSIDYYSGGGIDAIELTIDENEVSDKEHLKNIVTETVNHLIDSLY